MVKLGGKRKTHKVCKKHVNLTKSEVKFAKVGGNNNFPEMIGVNVWKQRNQGEMQYFQSMTKKGHQKFWRMKI